MSKVILIQRIGVGICSIFLVAASAGFASQDGIIPLNSDQWDTTHARIEEFKGRTALSGRAFLKNVNFTDGVIEVDLFMRSGRRSYPGLIFRIQSPGNYERFYVRPHRSNLYADALQYTGVINGIAEWQICHGPGYTGYATIPTDGWVRLRMEIKGSQARVYLSDNDQPVLYIHDLRHGVSSGTIGVEGPADGTAYFSNFRYRHDNNLQFDPPPHSDNPPGMIKDWELSPVFKLSQLDLERYPLSQTVDNLAWLKVESENSGLVDIARYRRRTGNEPDCILARAVITADKSEVRKMRFGYSDLISVFLDGRPLFSGNSAYRSRDLSFLGIVGLFDTVYLPLQEGENELLLVVAESFGGWGFLCQDGTTEFVHSDLKREWVSNKAFRIPESIAYDALNDVFYVSNYDGYHPGRPEGQSVSKVSFDGQNVESDWVQGLANPTGMAIHKDKLFVVERTNLAVIDTQNGTIAARYPVANPGFLNDIAVDSKGAVFISDSTKSVIYRFDGKKIEVWYKGPDIKNPNGLLALDDRVIVGNNGDVSLKAIMRESKEVEKLVRFRSGIIDGIQMDPGGGFLVSLNEGKLFRVTQSGEITKLLDTSVQEVNCADFIYVPEKDRLLIPTFLGNRIMGYSYCSDIQ